MKDFQFNVLKRKDEQDRDLQWDELLSNGYQLRVSVDEDDHEIKELITKIQEKGFEHCDAKLITNFLLAISTKTPPIFLNMSEYVNEYPNTGLFAEVPPQLKSRIYAITPVMTDDNKLSIAWNVYDTCCIIADILTKNKRNSKILVNRKTHITALDIRFHDDDSGGVVVITPTIENIENS